MKIESVLSEVSPLPASTDIFLDRSAEWRLNSWIRLLTDLSQVISSSVSWQCSTYRDTLVIGTCIPIGND